MNGETKAQSLSAPAAILEDYRLAVASREASLLGRKEVLTGKAKFGIFGDGKELAQIALAKHFRPGDFRSGYYRDQTWMMAIGALTLEQFFAQLYADSDAEREPASSGRQMTAHFATRLVDERGEFLRQTDRVNSASDLSPVASQMPRLVGLAQASKVYRSFPDIDPDGHFSRFGNEVAFGSIGNASCAEGIFWESVNAIGVLEVPAVISIWDDGFGISVPNEYQITKSNISEILAGFARDDSGKGFNVYRVPGWDYDNLVSVYETAVRAARIDHTPALVHVTEVTQPQGHSTSGSHERYKSEQRLRWEEETDCVARFRRYLLERDITTDGELQRVEEDAREAVRMAQRDAWDAYQGSLRGERERVDGLLRDLSVEPGDAVDEARRKLARRQVIIRRDLERAATEALVWTAGDTSPQRKALERWRRDHAAVNLERYGSDLDAATWQKIDVVPAQYAAEPPSVNGFEILNHFFEAVFQRDARVLAFGQDVGKLGDVNQGMAGMQAKFGDLRVADAGIREATILGQAIGLALRGLKPIAEIQYLDYLLYALQIMSDDLASLRWRTQGRQMAPVIVRTRGHRLEGVWHSGSPMGGLVHMLRGMAVCVPRNMVQAAGMYNTLLQGNDPGLVVEVLNAYRSKELLPGNLGEATVPLGVPEVLRKGGDVTVVTYGACCPIVLEAADLLAGLGVEIEVVDVRTLLPFDSEQRILASVRETGRLVVVDEDVPGGASAFMLQQIVERDGAFAWLDATPKTITGAAHRPAYGTDGDYYSKPNRESVVLGVYELMREASPDSYPAIV